MSRRTTRTFGADDVARLRLPLLARLRLPLPPYGRVVSAGGGISCVSMAAVATELKGRRLAQIRVTRLDLRREITLLIHKRKYIQKYVSEFLDYARPPIYMA